MKYPNSTSGPENLFREIRTLIEAGRHEVAVSVNASMTQLYWEVGTRIRVEVLKGDRADYGQKILISLAEQLTREYGGSFSEKNLRRMVQFASAFEDRQIVATLSRQLTWSHFKELLPLEDPLKQGFYLEMAKLEKWSVRRLRERIQSMLYERTAISRKPEETVRNELQELGETGTLTPDLVFRDPYFLDFLNLKDSYSEKDLETAITAELQRFVIEFGSDFAFMARQKRMPIDHRDYYLDLLFYHRRLKAMVAIDLKLGEFEAADKAQMELYLAWLEKHEAVEGENPPIGLILCAGKNPEHVELLQLHRSNIKIADYFTILPSRELLLDRFHKAIDIARNRHQNASD